MAIGVFDAELRHRGIVVNAKKIRRLMREHALNPRQRRRFIATTDSDHNYPVFPNLAKNMKLDGPNQLWVADITYVTIATGFVYLAAILDAWSPSRHRLRHRPLDRCTARCCCTQGRHRRPRSTKGLRASFRPWIAICSDDYRAALQKHGLTGSMAGAAIPTTTPRPRAS